MGRNRFASAETVRIELSDGDWVEVKKYLTHGERYHLYGSAYRPTADGNGGNVDLESAAIEYLATWIVEWSFHRSVQKTVVRDGQQTIEEVLEPVEVSRDAIRALDPDSADEVQAAIAQHVRELDRGKARTNGRDGPRARSR